MSYPRTPWLFYCVGFTRGRRLQTLKKKQKHDFTNPSLKKFALTTLSTLSFIQTVFSRTICAISVVLRLLVSCYFCKRAVLQVFSQFFFLWGVNFILHGFGLFPTSPCKQEYFWRQLCVNAFLSCCFFFRECFQKFQIQKNAVSVKTGPRFELIRPIFPSSLVNSVQSIVGVSVCSWWHHISLWQMGPIYTSWVQDTKTYYFVKCRKKPLLRAGSL